MADTLAYATAGAGMASSALFLSGNLNFGGAIPPLVFGSLMILAVLIKAFK